jgi:probable HAF family extracellular repeat protein
LAATLTVGPGHATDATRLSIQADCRLTMRVIGIARTTLAATAGLSNRGKVAGTAGPGVAALWRARQGVGQLGTLGGGTSRALAVNDRGRAVGESAVTPGGDSRHAFVWVPGGPLGGAIGDLGTLGGASSTARAINNQHRIVGDSQTVAGITHAFFWSDRTGMIDIDQVGSADSAAHAINDGNRVVGRYAGALGPRAFLWTADAGMRDLGTLGGGTAVAADINNRGRVVGTSTLAGGGTRAFLWTERQGMQDLGTLGGDSGANAINRFGEVVGQFATADAATEAFVWNRRCGMINLNGALGGTSGVLLSRAIDINDRGRILAEDADGSGYLLIPQAPPPPAPPADTGDDGT